MKLFTYNNKLQKTLNILLLSSFIFTPALARVETDNPQVVHDQPTATQDVAKAPENDLSHDELQALLKIFMAVRETVREKLLHPLFSKIDTLKLMVSNDKKNLISLTENQKKEFLTKINHIQTVAEKHSAIFASLEPQDLAASIQFGAQLADYLSLVITKQLKNIDTFTFKFEPKRAPTDINGMIEDLFKIVNRVEALDDKVQELGVSKFEKFKRRLSALNKKYMVDQVLLGTGLVTLIGLLACYMTQDPRKSLSPQFHTTDKGYETLAYLEDWKKLAQANDEESQHMADILNSIKDDTGRSNTPLIQKNSTLGQKKRTNGQSSQFEVTSDGREILMHLERWRLGNQSTEQFKEIGKMVLDADPLYKKRNFVIDSIYSFVGHRSYEGRLPDWTNGGTIKYTAPGTGVFGTIETHFKALLGVAAFMTIAKATVDEFGNHVKNWKAFNKSPKGFVKWEELLYNEQKHVSPIEELFLLNALERVEPRITFDDITGLKEQKQELQTVINYLLHPDLFERTGTTFETGYLFYGPTRTGKTLLAEALAGELILKHKKPLVFFKIRGSELRFVGIKKILEVVKKYAPCICFIDELDLLNLQRDQNTSLLDEFLTSMKTDGKKQVIWCAATNRIDHIDHALLQPGRFGKILTFENPSLKDRKDFFKQELMLKNIFDPSLDLDKLAQETENCSFGDLSSIVNDAVAQATQKRQKLSYKHFDAGIDSFKRRIADSTINLPDEERKLIAVHLSGHALGFALLPTSEILHKITMLPIQKRVTEEKIWLSDLTTAKKITYYGDVFTLHKTNTGGFDTSDQKINYVKVLLAGHLAEKLILGSSSYSYHNEDNEKARQILENLVFKGVKKENISKEERNRKLEEVMQLFNKYEAEVMQFLTDNKDKLVKMIDALQQRLTLTGAEVQALISESPQPLAAAAA